VSLEDAHGTVHHRGRPAIAGHHQHPEPGWPAGNLELGKASLLAVLRAAYDMDPIKQKIIRFINTVPPAFGYSSVRSVTRASPCDLKCSIPTV
jgi:hypothetical protein